MKLLLPLLFISTLSLAQVKISVEEFFTNGMTPYARTESTKSQNISFPLIDKYEFRTETKDWDFELQEYTFRVTPSTAKIRKSQQAYYQSLNSTPDIVMQDFHCDRIISLYEDWLKLYIISERQSALNQLKVVLSDQQSVYDKMLGSYDIDVDKVLKLYKGKSDLAIELNELEIQKNYLLKKYQLDSRILNFDGFVTINKIEELLDEQIKQNKPSDIVDIERQQDREFLTREIEMEKSERSRMIDFVQLKYNGPHTDLFRERVSLGLGFQLDRSSGRKLKLQELRIEKEALDRKIEIEYSEQQLKVQNIKMELDSDIDALKGMEEILRNEEEVLHKLSSKILQKQDASPLTLIEIEMRLISMKIEAIEMKSNVLRNYLKFLNVSGNVCASNSGQLLRG